MESVCFILYSILSFIKTPIINGLCLESLIHLLTIPTIIPINSILILFLSLIFHLLTVSQRTSQLLIYTTVLSAG